MASRIDGARVHRNYRIAGQVMESNILWSRARRAIPIEKIRAIMVAKGLSQNDIAERLNITNATVSRLLKGNQNITLDTLFKLCDAIEEPISIVIGAE